MKCYSCGGEVSLTDKVCPYCGRALTETASYRADEEEYKQRSKKTKKKADEIVSGNLALIISATAMVFLVIGVIVACYVNDNAYFFQEDARHRESVKKYEERTAEMQEYLDAGDYTGFFAYKEYHNIAELKEPFDDYKLLCKLAEEYTDMVWVIESVVVYDSDAQRYGSESDVNNCYWAIEHFYDEFKYNQSDIDKDPYKEYMYDMKDKADIILEVYFGLDENGRKEYFESSDLRKKAYLEGVLINE